jgi:hypothetical protein
MSGRKLNAVQYKGAAPALTDVIAGHIPMMFVSTGLIVQPWKAGQLRPLGVGSRERLPVSRVADRRRDPAGLYRARLVRSVRANGTPRDIVVKINNAVQHILADRGFRDRFLTPNLYEPMSGSPEQFAEDIHRDSERWQESHPRRQAGDRRLIALGRRPSAAGLRVCAALYPGDRRDAGCPFPSRWSIGRGHFACCLRTPAPAFSFARADGAALAPGAVAESWPHDVDGAG